MQTRIETLRKLVSWEIIDISKDTGESEETVLLRWTHIERVLSRYMLWEVDSEYLWEWASLIESREDIIFEEKNKNIIWEVIHLLSSQDLEKKLSNSYIQAVFLAIE